MPEKYGGINLSKCIIIQVFPPYLVANFLFINQDSSCLCICTLVCINNFGSIPGGLICINFKLASMVIDR